MALPLPKSAVDMGIAPVCMAKILKNGVAKIKYQYTHLKSRTSRNHLSKQEKMQQQLLVVTLVVFL